MTAVLEVRGLVRRFSGLSAPVLAGVDLDVAAGEAVAIVGPSGSGKSTLLSLIAGLDVPDAGRVVIQGAPLSDAVRRDHVGFVFQEHRLLPALSALDNATLPWLADRSRVPPEAVTAAIRLLGVLGLGDRLHHLPGALSAGQRQRVAVARALARGPSLVLADEPTAALDAATAVALVDALRAAQGAAALVVVTHDPAVAARMDRVLSLSAGGLHAGERGAR
jgi:ABC-type lipoprotein export system ATPase subunit